MSTPAIWCRVVQSRDVSRHNFNGLAMSSSAFSVAPLSHTLPTAISLFTLVNIHLYLLYVLLVFPRVLSGATTVYRIYITGL